jgi:small subunit ribosomal protein S16
MKFARSKYHNRGIENMAVVLRLKRTGAKNNSCFRIVAMDRKSARNGRAIEELGFYDPRHKDEKCNLERAQYWLSVGAQPSDTVKAIVKRAQDGVKLSDRVKPVKPSRKAVAKMEAEKEAKEAAKADEAKAKEAAKVEAAEAKETAKVKATEAKEAPVVEEAPVAEEAPAEEKAEEAAK